MMHTSYPNSATPYAALPNAPRLHDTAIPRGPWQNLYRAAPGAQLPAVRYPGMMGAALGSVPGVGIVGALGAAADLTKSATLKNLLIATLVSTAYGAGIAYFIESASPVRNTALYTGGLTVGAGLLSLLVAKSPAA